MIDLTKYVFNERIPVVTERPSTGRRKRQVNDSNDDFFDFDFDGFESNFESGSEPGLDPDFEPAIDLPIGKHS